MRNDGTTTFLFVTPAQAGARYASIQQLGPGLRRDDMI